jgi:hydroxylaminobenzene mutase
VSLRVQFAQGGIDCIVILVYLDYQDKLVPQARAMLKDARPSAVLVRQSHRLLQVGVTLLLFTCAWGFVFPHLASPQLGLSAHKLTSLLASLFLALGLLWPRLSLGPSTARATFLLFLYSSFVISLAYVLGTIWGAGGETMRLAAQGAHGTSLQETVIAITAYSSAPTGIIAFALILWGLRVGKDGMSAPEDTRAEGQQSERGGPPSG